MAVQREQVVQTAEKYVSRGKIEPAIREYRKLLTDNPNDINTLNRIGDLYARIQRIDEAVDFFTQIAEQYTTEGFFVKAIAIYKKIIKLDPTRLEVYEKLAELYHKQGLVNEARTQYQVLADYYQKHDNAASAIAIYQKMADLEPGNPSYHVKLAEIYHQQQLIEKAVGEYRVIAEMMIAHGRSQDAAQVYERALDVDSSSVSFIQDAIDKLRESGNAAAAARFLSIAAERNPQAARLAHLIRESEPEVEVEAEPEVEPEPEPPLYEAPSAAPPEEETPVFVIEEDDLSATIQMATAAASPQPAPPVVEEFELDLDEVFVLDMEGDEEPTSLVKPPPDMADTGLRLGSAWAEATAEALAAEELTPVSETGEEEVLAELELELEPELELAAEPLSQGPLEAFESVDLPSLDGSGEILFELEEEIEAKPREPEFDADFLEQTASSLYARPIERDEDLVSEAEVLAKYGLEEKALERLHEALRIRPQNLTAHSLLVQMNLEAGRHETVVELANAMARAAAEAGDTQVWPKSRRHLMDAGYRLDGDHVVAGPRGIVEEPAAPPAPAPPPQAAEEVTLEPAPPSEPEPVAEPVAVAPAPPPAAPAPPAAPRRKSSEIDQMLRGILGEKPKRPAPPRPAAAPAASAPPPVTAASAAPAPPPPPVAKFNPLEIGEMIEREEFDWGPEPAAIPSEPIPSEPPEAPAEPVYALTPGLEDTGGLSWLDEADRTRPPKAPREESLFDEEDDFFDLAAELEQELSQEDIFQSGDGLLVQPAEQSLEEIVEGFKKGVAEHLSPTDYDTHFNLGIAYREMGLLDEAIGEFQIAAKDSSHLVICCSMLGLCFLDKGLPELAIKWYRRGLEAPGVGEEDTLGLLYDLGCAHLAVGDKESAYKAFVDLYGINTNYRDVVARIEELGPR